MKLSDINIEELSPMMQQYAEIKAKYQEELLFFRLGDFYELFFEDAILASHELELTLTGKNAGLKERVPMCGIPHHAVKSYIEKLINKGFKVAICEQLEDPRQTKGMVKRDVIEVITKGTMVDLEFLNDKDFNYIGSIIDYNYIYLLTITDISTGEVLSMFINHDDSALLNEVLNYNLKEIIVTNEFNKELLNLIKTNYGINISINNEVLDNEYTSIYKNIEDERIIYGIKHLLYYLHVKELKDLSHLAEVQIVNKEAYLNMDVHTVRNLELIETLRVKERKNSLLWLLDKTKTAMGSRMLKYWLMNPLRDKESIEKRYDYIENLNNNFLLREELRNDLYEIYDLERLCGKLVSGSINGRDVLQIKNSLKVLPDINRIIEGLGYEIKIDTHENIYDLLEKAIYEEPPIGIKEGYLIKTGYNEELDELKSIRSGGKEFISSIENELKSQTGINNLHVGYNKVFGYYIEISKGNISKISPDLHWERRQTLTNAERYITPELKEKEALILNAEEKIIDLEYNLFCEIKEILKENVFKLKSTATMIAELDVLSSLSIASEEHHLIRPIIDDNSKTIKIENGFHPVIEYVSKNEYIKNDIMMDDRTNVLLITGPNMSGKSTYMRQLAITIIMAQMGSFVPATSAILPIFDAIYTRIGASDDLVSGESTFMVEMLEAKHAICEATDKSLILFDELGRGTATYDGMSIAGAIIEYLTENVKAKTLFSTHYHELTDLDRKYKSIKNIHVEVAEENGEVTFLHKISEGPIDKSYGIHVASLAGIPESVINKANELLEKYENKTIKKKDSSEQLSLDLVSNNIDSEITKKLKELNIMNITPIEAINILFELKNMMK